MGITTPINWCDSTVNPTMGCDGCELWNKKTNRYSCYAGLQHNKRGKTNHGYSSKFEILTPKKGRMVKAAKWKDLRGQFRRDDPWMKDMPRMIFVSDMSDALSEVIPFGYLYSEVIDNVVSKHGKRHIWQWLTKRPDRMAEFSDWLKNRGVPWPANLWAGTSLTTNGSRARIMQLGKVPAKVRFLSVEPQIEEIDLAGHLEGIHWVIQGGESGNSNDPDKKARPFHLEWADKMLQQCKDAKVPYFMKQLGRDPYEKGKQIGRKGKIIKIRNSHGSNWGEWPRRLKVRKFPAI